MAQWMQGRALDLGYLELSKAFSTDSCNTPFSKLIMCGLGKWTKRWTENWPGSMGYNQQHEFSWSWVTGGVPHRSTVEPTLLIICINGPDNGSVPSASWQTHQQVVNNSIVPDLLGFFLNFIYLSIMSIFIIITISDITFYNISIIHLFVSQAKGFVFFQFLSSSHCGRCSCHRKDLMLY